MTRVIGNKREHLHRTKELMATGQVIDLHYAALELRMCLEAMTYDKLRTFEKYSPPSALEKWQPPKLLKAMTQFDSGADKSVKIFMGAEAVPGVPADPAEMKFVGEHKAFGLEWLNKHYNKLGSLLHLQRKSQPAAESKLRGDLQEIAAEIEQAQSGSILGSWMGELAHFECELCKTRIHVSRHFVERTGSAFCLNRKCEAECLAKIDGSKSEFLLRATECPCASCGETMLVETRRIKPGEIIECAKCNHRHAVRWGYVSLQEQSTQGAPAHE